MLGHVSQGGTATGGVLHESVKVMNDETSTPRRSTRLSDGWSGLTHSSCHAYRRCICSSRRTVARPTRLRPELIVNGMVRLLSSARTRS